jgi:hypothetical protein
VKGQAVVLDLWVLGGWGCWGEGTGDRAEQGSAGVCT